MTQQSNDEGKLVKLARLADQHRTFLERIGWIASLVLSVLTTMYIKNTVAATREEQALRGRIDDLQDKVCTLEKRFSDNLEKCKELEVIIERNKIEIAPLCTKLALVEKSVQELSAETISLNDKVAKLAARSEHESDSQSLQELRSDILKLQKKIEALNKALTALLNQ